MNTQELNRKIAEMKGLHAFVENETCYIHEEWTKQAVDYINDPARILEMDDELNKAGWNIRYDKHHEEYMLVRLMVRNSVDKVITHKNRGKATGIAWIRMKEND